VRRRPKAFFLGGLKGCSSLNKKALLVSAFFVGAIYPAQVLAFCPVVSSATRVEVQRVVDGDTVRLKDGRSVRLIGINTPELARQGRAAEPLAETARRRLQALVAASGGQVGWVPGRERHDRHGRELAHLYGADGQNLGSRLLAEGLAYQIVMPPNSVLSDCQQAAEQRARQAGLGLWAQASVLKADQIDRSGFVLLSGRVSNVRRNRRGLWIELQGNVVLHVAPERLNLFDSAALDGLKGRQVEARGWLVRRSGRGGASDRRALWLLSLSHPAMLRVTRR